MTLGYNQNYKHLEFGLKIIYRVTRTAILAPYKK